MRPTRRDRRAAAHCDECLHWRKTGQPWSPSGGYVCQRNHAPRWFNPKSSIDTDYGWKRKCRDFEALEPGRQP